jgi:hypothetical protein
MCNRGEYVSDDCDGECEGEEECIMTYDDGCYTCLVRECPEGQYENPADCEEDCPGGTCYIDDESFCLVCHGAVTCESLGYYDKKSDCESDCDDPDYCASTEGDLSCWYCVDVTLTCGDGLYDEDDCDGDCPEFCEVYDDGPCYWCYCADLVVTSRKTYISLSGSYVSGPDGDFMECTREGYVELKVGNGGTADAPATQAHVAISPGNEKHGVDIPALGPGKTSSKQTIDLAESYSGPGNDCSSLDWWDDSYTVTFIADAGDLVAECDEGNEKISIVEVEAE